MDSDIVMMLPQLNLYCIKYLMYSKKLNEINHFHYLRLIWKLLYYIRDFDFRKKKLCALHLGIYTINLFEFNWLILDPGN